MKKYLVITALGPDRPGIVDAVADYTASRQCNLEESRMTVLGGEFAIIVLVSGPDKNIRTLQRGLPALGKKLKLSVTAKATRAQSGARAKDCLPFTLTVSGMDQQGLVHAVTQVLAARKINIESLTTSSQNAPITGTPLFSLEALLEVPAAVAIAGLRQDLEAVCNRLNIDYRLEPAAAR
jgi:glycine cleavage system transcriptional repressor